MRARFTVEYVVRVRHDTAVDLRSDYVWLASAAKVSRTGLEVGYNSKKIASISKLFAGEEGARIRTAV